MQKFIIGYGLSDGFGGIQTYEVVWAKDISEADKIAWERACEEYTQYEGMHGLRTLEEIMEEEGVDESGADYIWREERESWIEYTSTQLTQKEVDIVSSRYHFIDNGKINLKQQI